MTPLAMVQVAISLSMALIVLSLGLRCSVREATSLMRNTGLLLRSLLAMGVLFPLCAVLLVIATDLSFPVKVGLIAFAISPIPPNAGRGRGSTSTARSGCGRRRARGAAAW